MHRQPVTSSNIESVGYDSSTQTMEVRFRNGRTYRFAGVPQETHDALLSAPSVGRAFNELVKGRFEGQRVEDQESET